MGGQTTPIHICNTTFTGKGHGFYGLSQQKPPPKAPPPISPDDELFVINRIREFTFTLLKEERKHSISANQNAPFGQPLKSHDVINHSQHTQNKTNAFCQFNSQIQLPSLSLSHQNLNIQIPPLNSHYLPLKNSKKSNFTELPPDSSNSIQPNPLNNTQIPTINNPQSYKSNPHSTINVVTRNNPNFNTYERPITKRARKPKKRTMLSPNSENPTTSTNPISVATQTELIPPQSNIGQGREPIDEMKHKPLFKFENEPPPNYRSNLTRVFGEEFLAEASLKDRNLQNIFRLVKSRNWEELKLVSKYYYNIRNDLSVAPSGCLIYDGKLVIPYQLQNLVINAVHRTHPGQVGVIRLANLIWFPQIHRTIALRAENCRQCLDQGKNLKPIKPKLELGVMPKLSEPNEDLQMDFAGPLLDTKIIITNITS